MHLLYVGLVQAGLDRSMDGGDSFDPPAQLPGQLAIVGQDFSIDLVALLLTAWLQDVVIQKGVHFVVEKDAPIAWTDLDQRQLRYLVQIPGGRVEIPAAIIVR